MDYSRKPSIAFGQNINYVLIDADIIDDDVKDKKLIISKNLLDQVIANCNIKEFTICKEFKGNILSETLSLHPCMKKVLITIFFFRSRLC